MAGSSLIGALRVSLGLDSAQFTAGLSKAEARVAGFGASAKVAFAAVAAAALATGAALSLAVKSSIDHADALSKSAQKAGVTVESLSRLEYAAKLSDLSLKELTDGLGKLGRSMVDAAKNSKGDAARAFAALGISIKDANGNLRSSDSVLKDVADRFSRFEDGATKTALAVAMFGKSGAELIPLLNGGAAGLKAMADESDRLGTTITTKTAGAAEQFNDTLTRIGAGFDGITNQIMEASLPAMQHLADALNSPAIHDAAVFIGTNLVNAFAWLGEAIQNDIEGIKTLGGLLKNIPVLGLNTGFKIGGLQIGPGEKGPPGGAFSGGWGSDAFTKPAAITVHGGKPPAPPFDPSVFTQTVQALQPMDLGIEKTTQKVETLADKIGGPLTDALQGFVHAIQEGKSPLAAFGDLLSNLGNQLLDAGIQMLVKAVLGGVTGGIGGPSFVGNGFGSYGRFASGTMSAPPGMAWVGEQGPELVKFRGGEQVFDATRSAKMSAGGGDTYIVNADSFSRGADLANTIRSIVKQELPASVRRQSMHPHRG